MSLISNSHGAARVISRVRAWLCRLAGNSLRAGICLGFAAAATAVAAHEGHDHGPALPPLPLTVKPRLAVETDLYQLVAIGSGGKLLVFLDRYASNEPVTDAAIAIAVEGRSIAAAPRPDGSYLADIPGIGDPGRHELIFTVSHATGDDLLAGALEVPASLVDVQAGVTPAAAQPWSMLLTAALALIAGIAIGFGIKARRPPVIAAIVAACLALGPLITDTATAHDGHEASPVPDGQSLTGDVPRRLGDGSVFLPKPSQRLLTIRSQIAVEGHASPGVSLVGRIIADPNRSGIVQSINGGRVNPAERGLPRLGQAVKRGEVLATVEPALPLADQSTLAEKQRDLEGAILLARQRHSRLSRLGANITPRSNIEDTELEISNLEQRLAGLESAKLQSEILTAPIDGVVSTSRVVAGQVVAAQDVLFQIVDPTSLWVEAILFDQLDPGRVVEATAIIANGPAMRLSYRGRGRTLQAQATQIQFAIDQPPAGAALGQPVTVIARRSDPVRGMLLPRDAITRGPAGESVVWQHLEPERFVARPVRFETFDGAQVMVTGGVAPKDRIVVHGAELLSQVR